MPRKPTTDALEILDRRIFELRTEHRLTQTQLAKLVGTSRSVISRLEDDDYAGHSLSLLRRIAAVFRLRVQVRFVSLPKTRAQRAPS